MSIKWGLSIVDWHYHAVDVVRVHPSGVYKAECNHTLLMVTRLYEVAYGRVCGACSTKQFNVARKQLPIKE